MRILIATSIFSTLGRPRTGGGSDLVVRRIVDGLVRHGHEVQVIRAGSPPHSPERVNGALVHDAAAPNIYHWQGAEDQRSPIFRAIWHAIDDHGFANANVERLLENFRPNVLATHNLSGLSTHLWTLARKRGIPVVHTLHDYHLLCPATTRRKMNMNCSTQCTLCSLLTSRRRMRVWQVDYVVSVSAHVATVHQDWGLFDRETEVRIVHNAVNPVPGARAPDYDGRRPIRIGFIGRGSRYKGLPLLLDAFARLQAPATLSIAGVLEPEAEAKLAQHPKRDAIASLGYVDSFDFYSSIDLVVVPSLGEEAFGMPCIEAQAYGRAVAGSIQGGIPEAIGGMEYGWLFDPEVSGALEAVLEQAAANPSILISKARAGIRKSRNYTLENFTAAHENILREAAIA